jgi:hypothetical protein
MKISGRAGTNNDLPKDEVEWREIPCANREEAEAEAQRQQELDDATEVEWIYLRNKNSEWVARRTPLRMTEKRRSRWAALGAAMIDSFHP